MHDFSYLSSFFSSPLLPHTNHQRALCLFCGLNLYFIFICLENELTLLKRFGETYENKTQQVTVTHMCCISKILLHVHWISFWVISKLLNWIILSIYPKYPKLSTLNIFNIYSDNALRTVTQWQSSWCVYICDCSKSMMLKQRKESYQGCWRRRHMKLKTS